jgi:DNA-binding response OmpR family regulator
LLVDDEPHITFALAIGLEDNGFEDDTFNDPLLDYKLLRRRNHMLWRLSILKCKR